MNPEQAIRQFEEAINSVPLIKAHRDWLMTSAQAVVTAIERGTREQCAKEQAAREAAAAEAAKKAT